MNGDQLKAVQFGTVNDSTQGTESKDVGSPQETEIKFKLDQLKNEDDIVKVLQARKAQGYDVFERMEMLKSDLKIISYNIHKQMKKIEALGNRRSNDHATRSLRIFSSEQILDDTIKGIRYQFQHHTIPLKRQLIQQISRLEKTRKEVIAKATLKNLKYEERAILARMKEETEKIKALREDIQILNNKLQDICKQREEVSDSLKLVEATLSNAKTDIKEEEAMISIAETEIKEAETDIKEEAETEKAMLSNAETDIKEEEAMISNAETEIKEEATEIKEEATDVKEEAETALLAAIEEDKLIFQAMKALYDVILKKIADSHSQSAPEENLVPNEATVAMFQVLEMLVKLSDILNGEEKETIPGPEQPIPEPIKPWVYVVLLFLLLLPLLCLMYGEFNKA